jgi:hypothetical protein
VPLSRAAATQPKLRFALCNLDDLIVRNYSDADISIGATVVSTVVRRVYHAAKGIVPGCDLVWLRQTPFRLVRKGSEEPWRGTLCRIEGETYLFTSGYVPWWDEFPGAHIPAPIQIGSAGDTDIEARAREILTLSKMNWNSSDGITPLPVTLLFAKKVGEIMTELSDNANPNPSFRFHT